MIAKTLLETLRTVSKEKNDSRSVPLSKHEGKDGVERAAHLNSLLLLSFVVSAVHIRCISRRCKEKHEQLGCWKEMMYSRVQQYPSSIFLQQP